jgi:hypothetical protein
MQDDRYARRPLLRLLDCYVLALTGHLDPQMESKVAAYVRRQFGGNDWRATLRQTVQLPVDMDDRIRSLWQRQPSGVDPLEFALAVSDENFLPMLEDA